MIQIKKENKINKQLQQKAQKPLMNAKRKKMLSKQNQYQTNIDNYVKKYDQAIIKIDPKGITANSVYVSLSGVIQSLQLFQNKEQDLQLNYKIKIGQEWRDQTPQTSDSQGNSPFCSAKNGKITFSLGFDTLISCMYIQTWPQIIMALKGFDNDGDIIVRGYAQIFLPTSPGVQIKQAVVYQIVRNVKWYHNWLPFLQPQYIHYDDKQIERVIIKGEGRENQKIRCIGKIKIRTEVLLRNFQRFGYK